MADESATPASASPPSRVLPKAERLLVMAVMMGATLIVILDTTIANVALPHMQASLGASPDSISWVLTSYILANAVALPVTGWLSDRIGRRMLFTAAIAGFTVSSALCGISTSLTMIVAARLAQGICGAFIMPMSQAIMYDINPPEKHVQAMTLWGMVIMVGPIMGPVLGGWLTDNFNWRWVFYINVPIGIATALASWRLVAELKGAVRKFDWTGAGLLALALGSFQLMLDRGVQLDWFDSLEIWIEACLAVSALWMFVVHTATARDPLLPRAMFADRNFVMACAAAAVVGGVLMAGAALVAPMLQRLFGYPVLDAGLLTAPRGVGTLFGMLIAGRLARLVDPRIPITIGLALLAASLWMMSGFSLDMDSRPIIWSGLVQGFGLGLTVLPMNLLALATLPTIMRTEGASLYNLTRSMGGSIAISVMTALIASNVQVNHVTLGADINAASVPGLGTGLIEQLGLNGQAAVEFLDAMVNRQSLMIAYIDDYWAMMWAAVVTVPLILFMRGTRPAGRMPPPDAH